MTEQGPTASSEAARRWRDDLLGWAIPDGILRSAEASPWRWPSFRFRPAAPQSPTPTDRAALEAVGKGGTVLDIGVGAGRSSLHLAPPATRIVGVDADQQLLDAFVDNAHERAVEHAAVLGEWPHVADAVEHGDVVICAHVVYNVADIVPFLQALTTHARRRVVVELTASHPTAWLTPLWERFHGVSRPQRPQAENLVEILRELGVAPHTEQWIAPAWDSHTSRPEMVEIVARRLCLPAARRPEVEAVLDSVSGDRSNLTVWWKPGS